MNDPNLVYLRITIDPAQGDDWHVWLEAPAARFMHTIKEFDLSSPQDPNAMQASLTLIQELFDQVCDGTAEQRHLNIWFKSVQDVVGHFCQGLSDDDLRSSQDWKLDLDYRMQKNELVPTFGPYIPADGNPADQPT